MAYNGSGVFSRLYNWVSDKAGGINITASRMDDEMQGFADGLSNAICRDGQTTITANIPFNSKKITGLADGTAATDSINVGQVQNNVFGYWGTTGGAADAYTLAPSPSITAYATTQQFTAKIHATNTTTTPYLQVSAIANPASNAVIKKLNQSGAEAAVEAGDLVAGGIYNFQRNSSNNAWILLQPNIASFTNQGISYLQKPIILSNNIGNPNTQIDFAAGNQIFTNGLNQANLPAITKTIQSSGSWTAGTNQNGLDTGVRVNTTWYYSYIIQNNSSGAFDVLFSASATSPTVPSGWTNVAQIKNGQVMTDFSGNLRTFLKFANGFTLYTPSQSGWGVDASILSPAIQTNTLQAITAPSQSNIAALVKLSLETSGTSSDTLHVAYAGSVNTVNSIPNFFDGDLFAIGDTGRYLKIEKLCYTNTAQIKYSVSSSTGGRSMTFLTIGYYDLN